VGWWVGQGGDVTGNGREFQGGFSFNGLDGFARIPSLLDRKDAEFTVSFQLVASYIGRTNRLVEIKSSDGTQCGLFTGEDDLIRLL